MPAKGMMSSPHPSPLVGVYRREDGQAETEGSGADEQSLFHCVALATVREVR